MTDQSSTPEGRKVDRDIAEFNPIRGDFCERFARHIEPELNSGCHLWSASGDRDGYGRYRVGRKPNRFWGAHRLSWIIHNGPIPQGYHLCHRCDTPACVNPDHLFLATREGNMRDMASKGRTSHPRGYSRITDAERTMMQRALSTMGSIRAVARQFSRSPASVRRALNASGGGHAI